MNNNQFRRLVLEKPEGQNGDITAAKPGSTPSTLGAKKSSFMPMTPRTVKGGIDVDFARQVRERNAALQPKKQFKSSAPKGVKYGAGYTDRAKARAEAESQDDDKAERIKALEEQMKLEQISSEMFEALRDEITGGDIANTHLFKGLDRKLLERVRRGEDVMGTNGSPDAEPEPAADVDEELDKLEDKEVETVQKEKVAKKGTMAPPPPVVGVKRSRNEIMAELKAQRKIAAEPKAAPTFDTSKWRKVGDQEKSRIEIDHKGREVLITVDEDGIVKKKVRKVATTDGSDEKVAIQMPDASRAILGADANIPAAPPPATEASEDDDDDDIFEGVGAQYNPLGDDDDDDDSSEADSDGNQNPKTEPPSKAPDKAIQAPNLEDLIGDKPAMSRNYFNDVPAAVEEPATDRLAGVQDLLKKAAKLDSANADGDDDDGDGDDEEDKKAKAARLKKRAEMLGQQDRDLDDMDMGFGSSRYDDGEDDGEGSRLKLSEWKGSNVDGQEGRNVKGDGEKRKRKPKKRKGDANNMSDIMRVIEGRKGAT